MQRLFEISKGGLNNPRNLVYLLHLLTVTVRHEIQRFHRNQSTPGKGH